jgi:hypothetical protein
MAAAGRSAQRNLCVQLSAWIEPDKPPAVREPSLGSVMSMTSKERLQEILLSLTEPEAEIVWEAYSSRPPEEDRGDALGRGLGDVYERRRARAADSGRDASG